MLRYKKLIYPKSYSPLPCSNCPHWDSQMTSDGVKHYYRLDCYCPARFSSDQIVYCMPDDLIVFDFHCMIYFLFSGICCGPCNNWHYVGHVEHIDDDDDDDNDDYTVSNKWVGISETTAQHSQWLSVSPVFYTFLMLHIFIRYHIAILVLVSTFLWLFYVFLFSHVSTYAWHVFLINWCWCISMLTAELLTSVSLWWTVIYTDIAWLDSEWWFSILRSCSVDMHVYVFMDAWLTNTCVT